MKKCKDGWISKSTGKGTCSNHGGMLFFNKNNSLLEKENKLWLIIDSYENTGKYPIYDSQGYLVSERDMTEKEYNKTKKIHYQIAKKLFKEKIPITKHSRPYWYKDLYSPDFKPLQEDWDYIDSKEDLRYRQSFERFKAPK